MTLHEAIARAHDEGGTLRAIGTAVAVMGLIATVFTGLAVGFYKLGQVSNNVTVNTIRITKNDGRIDKISDNQLEVRLDLASRLQQLQDQQAAIVAQLKILLQRENQGP